MDVKTLEALKGSIAKWEAIVAGTGVDEGSDNCPLCRLFLDRTPICDGCPVRAASGRRGCNGTPYHHWDAIAGRDGMATTPEAVAAAQAELDFLRSLLPAEEK